MLTLLQCNHHQPGQWYIYVGKWECEFDREVRENDTLRNFLQQSEMINPLEPRDAFNGGRTEAFTLFQKDQVISYVDVIFQYPYINKTEKISIEHPEIVTEGFTDIQQYEGLIKCKILPPRGLYMPVLPLKMNNNLLFTLCRTCRENLQQTPCQHNDEERSLTGTWVTNELKKALEKGYVVQCIYEVWHLMKRNSTIRKRKLEDSLPIT